jgi:YfiH family protein
MTPPTPNAAFHWSREPWGLALRSTRLDSITQHLFTSKQLEFPADQAWRDAVASIGGSTELLMRVKQVHGNSVRVIRRDQLTESTHLSKPDADAIVSNVPGATLAVLVADCVPILIADPKSGAAAAVHAGWRGTCASIVLAAVESMVREFGANPATMVAAIGPSIGPDDYEVGESLVESFTNAGHRDDDVARWFRRTEGKLRLDLWSANRDQLIAAGVAADHIDLCGLSTLPHANVFASYRRDAERAGRIAALIRVSSHAGA